MSYPLLMQAPVKDYIWGGTKLREKYHKVSAADKLAESWELSCHQDGPSIIANGEAQGKPLTQYIQEQGRGILGSKAQAFENFPIMIKLIDAKDNLSVQVHPDNAYALKNEGEYGKTEMWYVIEAEPGAELLYGVEKKITAQELADSLQNGTITDICHHAPVKKGSSSSFLPVPSTPSARASCWQRCSRTPTPPTASTTTAGWAMTASHGSSM